MSKTPRTTEAEKVKVLQDRITTLTTDCPTLVIGVDHAFAALRKAGIHLDNTMSLGGYIEVLARERDEARETLAFVERWANYHARKPKIRAEEALATIQWHPVIRAITESYADGKMPNTPDPWAQRDALETECEDLVKVLRTLVDVIHDSDSGEVDRRLAIKDAKVMLNKMETK